MAEVLVAGIAQSRDPAQITKMLDVEGKLDAQRLAIITKDSHADSQAGHGRQSITMSANIMTGSSGTGVPGLGGSGASLSSFGGGGGASTDYLGGLPMIAVDQAHHYNIAIAEGRSLVTYKATAEEAPEIEQRFRQAGLRNVKSFKPR